MTNAGRPVLQARLLPRAAEPTTFTPSQTEALHVEFSVEPVGMGGSPMLKPAKPADTIDTMILFVHG
jgi:hypothetical protein